MEYHVPTVVRIKMKGGTVVQGCDVYIGRKVTQGGWNLAASVWENPYTANKNFPVEHVVAKYDIYIRELIKKNPEQMMYYLKNLVSQGHSLTLGCWCKSDKAGNYKDLPCHGDVIVQLCKEMIIILKQNASNFKSIV